jgi:MOSC domain-containing protein YiiM
MTTEATNLQTTKSTQTGTVVAVCMRKEKGVPKYPQTEVTIGEYGVEGDYHSGPMRTRSNGQVEPNRRHVTLVAKEVFDDLNRELATDIPAGGFGENILVEGLGDLSDIKEGVVLAFSSGVELEVTGQNDPCKNLMVYHNQVPKRAYGRRGLLTIVRSSGRLKPGDSIAVRSSGGSAAQ